MESLELTAARLAIGDLSSEDLPMLAAEALANGVDSPALREAAGVSRSDVREARDCFVAALNELGIEIPGTDEALWKIVRYKASQIVSGEIQPYEGASWIWHNAAWEVEREGDLRIFIGLASEWQDHPDYRLEYDKQIIEEARLLVGRMEPRQWVMLKAMPGCWPLCKPPSPYRRLARTELPISETLDADLVRWAADFDAIAAAPKAGPSGFASPTDANNFVERGRVLTARLQAELGDDWHVEYWPTSTAFPPARNE